jgi:hypothetical protein
VSIVSRLKLPPANHLLVRNADWDPDFRNTSADIPDKIAICVKPIHFNYNQVNAQNTLTALYIYMDYKQNGILIRLCALV